MSEQEPNELLIIFNGLIQHYGGRERLINALEIELMKPQLYNHWYRWTGERTQFIINNYSNMSAERMAQILNISYNIVSNKIRDLKMNTDLLGKGRKPHIHFDVV